MALNPSLTPARGFPHFNSLTYPSTFPATITTAGAVTYTTQNLLGGMILRDPNGAGRSDALPAANLLVAALPGVAVGTTFEFILRNDAGGAFAITVTAGTGVTISGTATIAQSNLKGFRVRFTNISPGTEAYTIYSLGSVVF
jgi:hypothetical protein